MREWWEENLCGQDLMGDVSIELIEHWCLMSGVQSGSRVSCVAFQKEAQIIVRFFSNIVTKIGDRNGLASSMFG